MNAVVALVVGAVFAAGLYAMLRRDLFLVVCGTVMVTNAAILLVVALRPADRIAPFLPLADPSKASDPLAQAIALTALVIGFGTSVLLLFVVLGVARTHASLDVADMAAEEEAEEGGPA